MMILILFVFLVRQKNRDAVDPDTYYTCSMDPQVVEYKPGKCPICHMELTQVKKSSGENKDEISVKRATDLILVILKPIPSATELSETNWC
jgi:Cu(I)/Ag(I) efflux system membrane fusion protein